MDVPLSTSGRESMVCLGSSVPARRMPTPEWPHPYRVGYPGKACPSPPCDNPIVRSSHPVRVWRRRPTAMSKNASHGRAHLGCISGEHRSHRERRSAAPTGTCSARLVVEAQNATPCTRSTASTTRALCGNPAGRRIRMACSRAPGPEVSCWMVDGGVTPQHASPHHE